MSRKRKSNLTALAKKRDGWICQCCGRPGIEGHHIHPLVYGGPDELNNVITLCGLCHKYSPDDPAEFLGYQREGGEYMKRLTVGLRNQYAADVIRQAAEKRETIPTDEKINNDFATAFNETRCKTFGMVGSAGLLYGMPDAVKQSESRSKEENDDYLLNDKGEAEARLSYVKNFPDCEFTGNIAEQAAWFIFKLDELREEYGLTKADREKIEKGKELKEQASSFKMQSAPDGYTFSKSRGCLHWGGLIEQTARTAEQYFKKMKLLEKPILAGDIDGIEEQGRICAARYTVAFQNQTSTELKRLAVLEWVISAASHQNYTNELRSMRTVILKSGVLPMHVDPDLCTALVKLPYRDHERVERVHTRLGNMKAKWGYRQAQINNETTATTKQLTLAI